MYSDWLKGENKEQARKEEEVPQDRPATRVVEGAVNSEAPATTLFSSLSEPGAGSGPLSQLRDAVQKLYREQGSPSLPG